MLNGIKNIYLTGFTQKIQKINPLRSMDRTSVYETENQVLGWVPIENKEKGFMQKISGIKSVRGPDGETYYFDDEYSFSATINTPNPEELKKALSSPRIIGPDISNTTFEIQDSISRQVDENIMNQIFQEMTKRFSQVPIVSHTCHNCGAKVSMDADKHLFTCGYCGSAYAVGTTQIYS